jgi:hypothetical protein
MAETNMTAFVNSCSGYVHTYILGPIVQHLASKGVQVSVEELAGVLQLPATRSPVTPIVPTPSVPAMAFGGAVPTMAPAIAPTTARKTTATNAPVAGRTCMYQFKRGENKGKYCGKATAPGSDFCNACLKTRKNLQKEMAATGGIPGAAPAMGAIPGMGGLPPGYAAPTPTVPATTNAPAQGGQLSVVPYDEARGLFREPNHNFIVYQVSPGVIAVLGRLSETDNKIVQLTAQEQGTAQAIGLVLGEGATGGATPSPTAQVPTATHVPTVPTVPAIPTAVVQQTVPTVPAIPTAVVQTNGNLTGTGQPALPVIAPLATQATTPSPAVGATQGFPQIPGIPQILM